MKRIVTFILLITALAGCGTVVPYYGVNMQQKLLNNGVGTTCDFEPAQAFESSKRIVLLNATITTTTLLPNGDKFTTTCILTPQY